MARPECPERRPALASRRRSVAIPTAVRPNGLDGPAHRSPSSAYRRPTTPRWLAERLTVERLLSGELLLGELLLGELLLGESVLRPHELPPN
jgi:hypothetical protein